jgi:hypothetical protein
MKKAILAVAVLSAFSLASCKKEYTCECQKVRTDSEGNTTSDNDGSYTFKDSKPRAETRCNDQEGTGSDILGDYTRECSLD